MACSRASPVRAWAKLKLLLRRAKARTQEALDQALTQLLPEISPANALAWARLCFQSLYLNDI